MTIDQLHEIAAEDSASRQRFRCQLDVCVAAGCLSSRSDAVKKSLEEALAGREVKESYRVRGVGCMGLCSLGPLVSVEPGNLLYGSVGPDDAADIVEHLGDEPLQRLQCPRDVPFFERQVNVVLENSGRVDPERIEEYIAAEGYEGLLRALTEMTPGEVIEQVTRSGLRGRGEQATRPA